jgi:hypothetical protein
MEPPAFWRDLQLQFRALSDEASNPVAALDHEDGTWIQSGGPKDQAARRSLYEQFTALSVRAVAAAGWARRSRPSLNAWLNRLKLRPHYVPAEVSTDRDGTILKSLEGGWIDRVIQASAEFCTTLETASFVRTAPSVPAFSAQRHTSRKPGRSKTKHSSVFPKRASWLEKVIKDRNLSPSRIYTLGGPDKKTLLRIRQALPVQETVLRKLAKALTDEGPPPVLRADIPDA